MCSQCDRVARAKPLRATPFAPSRARQTIRQRENERSKELQLSTAGGNNAGTHPRVKVQSAGWVKFGWAPTHHRDDKRRAVLLKKAALKYPQACVEDVDSKPGRGFERSSMMSLALSRWVEDGTAILVTGPTGSGKSWLACALAQYACRRGHSALYLRVPRLAEDLRVLHGNGGFGRWLAAVARTDVLLLDDWGLAAMDGPTRADLMELIDDRAGTRPTIVTSQLPVEHWHAWIGDATVADAILDRLLSRSHRLNLKGKSMRPSKAAAVQTEGSDTVTPQDTAAA